MNAPEEFDGDPIWVPQVGVLADLCLSGVEYAQVSEYRDLWHPNLERIR